MRLLLAPCRAELVARGSKFLALAHSASSLEVALAVREAERRRHHDATHHVYAVRLGDGSRGSTTMESRRARAAGPCSPNSRRAS